ncbi:HDOD domain-containing protein [Pseudomonas sp. Marseille-Q8238]
MAVPRVIIGEADRWTAELLGQLVRSVRGDAEIVTVHDGHAVLEQWRRQPAQLLIADFGLPGVGGLDVLREVRRQREQPPLPFFLITEKVDAASVKAAVALTPTAYLAKPFDAEDMLRRLRAVLLKPGDDPVSPLPEAELHQSLDEFLQGRRESAAGAPVLATVQSTLSQLHDTQTLDIEVLAAQFRPDPQLTAQLIAAANSAALHVGSPCQTLPQALQRLGTKHSLNLALGVTLQRGVSLQDELLVEQAQALWQTSQRLAELARWLAVRIDVDAERCFTAGLLHRLGDLALLRTLQDWCDGGGVLEEETVARSLAQYAAPYGSALRTRWRLPLELRELIAAAYQLGSGVFSREALVVNLAAEAARSSDEQPFAGLLEHKAARMLRLDAALLL